MASEKMVAFLYLLLRDELPAGRVSQLVGEAQVAETIEYSSEVGALAWRLADKLGDGETPAPEPEPDDEEDEPVIRIERMDDGRLMPADREVEAFPKGMAAFLDKFDDRLLASPCFVDAVNEAVENGLPANDETAQLVGERVRELAAQPRGEA